MEEDNMKKGNSKMQLIIIEPNQNLEYYDVSKIGFHKVDDELCVIPTENKNEYIPIIFKRSFIHQNVFQRLICIDECESDPKKYLLIFSTAQKCINFIESIKNNHSVKDKLLITASSNDDTFKIKYLTPIIKIASKNRLLEELLNSVLSEILVYYKPPAATSISCADSVDSNTLVNDNNEIVETSENYNERNDENQSNLRKRPHPESIPINRKVLLSHGDTVRESNFKIINQIRNGICKSRLFIFPSSDKTLCYEYYYFLKEKIYICSGCRHNKNGIKNISATIEKDYNGVNYVKCLRNDHVCEPRKFEPENYQSDLIIKKPNYQFTEENINGKMKKYLYLYTSADKKMFYKLTYMSPEKSYLCTKCDSPVFKGCRKYINAHIGHDKNGEEFVYVRNLKHMCSKMDYLEAEEATVSKATVVKNANIKKQPKYRRTSHQPTPPTTIQNLNESKIIQKPNFQLFQRNFRGKMIKKLAIFDQNDSTMCYEFTWKNEKEYYICNSCMNSHFKYVYAKIIKNVNGEEEYVQMGKNGHQCKLKKFVL